MLKLFIKLLRLKSGQRQIYSCEESKCLVIDRLRTSKEVHICHWRQSGRCEINIAYKVHIYHQNSPAKALGWVPFRKEFDYFSRKRRLSDNSESLPSSEGSLFLREIPNI